MSGIELKVGRNPDCDIKLEDDSVSFNHAEIQLTEDGQLFVVDCHSTNGTYFISSNGQHNRIEQSLVPPDAKVCFGLSEHEARALCDLILAHEKLSAAKSGTEL